MPTIEYQRRVEYQSVKQAVSEWMTRNGHISSATDLAYRMSDDFGVSENSRPQMVVFQGQVRRALEQLVDENELIRDHGSSYANYRTPAEDARRKQADREAAEIAQRLRESWDRVHDRLRRLGIDGKMAGPVISLDLDAWGRLLGYAEDGRASCS